MGSLHSQIPEAVHLMICLAEKATDEFNILPEARVLKVQPYDYVGPEKKEVLYLKESKRVLVHTGKVISTLWVPMSLLGPLQPGSCHYLTNGILAANATGNRRAESSKYFS